MMMTLDEVIDHLTYVQQQYGDLPVAHEWFEEGPDEGCIVRLLPVMLHDVDRADDRSLNRLHIEQLHRGAPAPISELLTGLNKAAQAHGGALRVVLETDYGYIDDLDDIEVVHSTDQLGPFFEEDIVSIPPSLFPCALLRPTATF